MNCVLILKAIKLFIEYRVIMELLWALISKKKTG